jgi:prepilin signal peptidase PulO-like enzyme (type II secretory pathway)
MQALWIAVFILAGTGIGGILALFNRRWNARLIAEEEFDEEETEGMSKKEKKELEIRKKEFLEKKEAESKLIHMPFSDVIKERPGRFILCMILGALGSVSLVLQFGVDASTCVLLVYFLILILIAMIDFDVQYIPYELNICIFGLGILSVLMAPDLPWKEKLLGALYLLITGIVFAASEFIPIPEKNWFLLVLIQAVMSFVPGFLFVILAKPDEFIKERLLGMVILSPLFFLLYAVFRAVRNVEALGYGDLKFLIASGALLGWRYTVAGFFVGAIAGAIISVALMATKKKKRMEAISFGPYLCLGMYLSVIFGKQVLGWYLNMVFPPAPY